MKNYEIFSNFSKHTLGKYKGNSETHALAQCHKEAGMDISYNAKTDEMIWNKPSQKEEWDTEDLVAVEI